MARWQRRARLVFALFAVALVVVLFVVMRERVQQLLPGRGEALGPKVLSQVVGGDVIQVKGAKQDVRVKFSKQIAYEDGRTKFEDFEATAENRGGRTLVVTGKEAWVGSELSSYDLRGSVVLRTSDGLVAQSEKATYETAEGILRADGPVQFQRERVSGTGVGFTYDKQRDALWLLDQAVIRVAPEGEKGGMEVTSGTAGHSRQERFLRFERGVRMLREGQVIEAVDSTVFLLKDSDEPDTIELRGGSRITGANGTGSLQSMHARDINLDYGPDGRTLEKSLLAGQSGIQLAQKDGSVGQQLTAEYIDLQLAPDGAVTRIVSRDQLRVELPAVGDTAARTVTATTLNGTGEPGRGLTSMVFEGGVEYREGASRGTAGRAARAQTLKTAMAENATIERAEFTTGFKFEDGRLTATSTDAIYDVVKGTLSLTGADGAPPPHLQDERVAIDANTIDVTLSPRHMNAEGNVRTVLSAGRRQEGEHGTTLLKATESVFLFAEKLEFDEESGKGIYTGKVRLQQGETSIHGDTITLDERKGDLRAGGNVMTVLPIAGKQTGDTQSSIARAGEFFFEDTKRSVVYSKQAQMDGVQGTVKADRIALVLAEADNSLDRLEADGQVRVSIEKREATGKRLVYHPTDERYVLEGTPVRFLEACRETTGRTLTFYRGSDRISIDGNEEQRTQSKGGSRCPEPPAK